MTDFRLMVRSFDTLRRRAIGSSDFYGGAWSTSVFPLDSRRGAPPISLTVEVRQELRPCLRPYLVSAPCVRLLRPKLKEPSGRTEDSTLISNAGRWFVDETLSPTSLTRRHSMFHHVGSLPVRLDSLVVSRAELSADGHEFPPR
jgi:hypothetical protein